MLESGYRINNLIFAEGFESQEACVQLSDLAKRNKTRVLFMSGGDEITYGDTRIEVLSPEPRENPSDGTLPHSGQSASGFDVNENSLVLRVRCGDFCGLFGGDIGAETERMLTAQYDLSDVNLYKCDHHGSKNSSDMSFLEEMNPALTFVSAGEKNRYNHPSPEAVERIMSVCDELYCTKESGQLTLFAGEDAFRVVTKK